MLLLDHRQDSSCLLLLGVGAAALEDLEIDAAERHEAEGEARHDAGEEDQEAGEPGVDEEHDRPEGDLAPEGGAEVFPGHHPGHHQRIDQMHLSFQIGRAHV